MPFQPSSKSVFTVGLTSHIGRMVWRGAMKEWADEWQTGLFNITRFDETYFVREATAGVMGFVWEPDKARRMLGSEIPLIQFSNRPRPHPGVPQVINDDIAIGRLGAQHLSQKGYQNLIFVRHEPGCMVDQRWKGFVGEAKRQNTPWQSIQLPILTRSRIDRVPIHLKECEEVLLQALKKLDPPWGILAASDAVAVLVARILHKAAPDCLSMTGILGVDNNEDQLTLLPDFSLSSIEPDFEGVGSCGARLMRSCLKGESLPTDPVRLPPLRVVERQSTTTAAVNDPLVARGQHIYYANLEKGEAMQASELASVLRVSQRTLVRHFQSATGKGLKQALLDMQLERASKLLAESRLSVAEVAAMSGFNKQGDLSQHFRRKYGQTPRDYRAQTETKSRGRIYP